MAEIGRADLLIVPKFDELTKTVESALGKCEGQASKSGSSLGKSTGSGFGKGLAGSGAMIGAFSTLTAKAMDSVSSHVGSAISRFDTLNNYPKVMQSLGYSADSANASIGKMSDRLSTLPTRLDDMVSVVQGITATVGDLDKATDVGLALNDMLIASGSSTQLCSAAMEQFRQILSKGKPEMEDWRSLTTAAPGQMDQLAKSMLGPTANANDLYAALGGGGKDPTITLDQLMDKMVELDTQGGASFASFKDQAETAAGGVQTSIQNMSNSVTKGVTGTFEAIGRNNIAGVLDDAKGAVNGFFKVVNGGVSASMPMVKQLYGGFKSLAPEIVSGAAGIAAWQKAVPVLSGVASGVGKATEAFKLARSGAGTFAESLEAVGIGFNPVAIGCTVAAAGIGILIEKQVEWQARTDALNKATTGLVDAASNTVALESYAGRVENVGKKSSFSAMSVDELAESIGKHVDAMNENTRAAESQIAQLNTAQQIIDNYAGKTDLSTDAQGRLTWALQLLNDQLGLNISAQDVANGKYVDADGNVKNLKQSIDELVASKKKDAEVSALTANLTEAYQAQSEAANTLASKTKPYQDRLKELAKTYPELSKGELETLACTEKVGREYNEAKKQFDSASESIEVLNGKLGDASLTSQEAGSTFEHFAQAQLTLFQAQLSANGETLSAVSGSLTQLGVDTEQLAGLSDDQLAKLAQDYDGTARSIVDDLDGWGVSMDEGAASTVRAASQIQAALEDMGGKLKKAFSKENIDFGAFSDACAAAGVSTETLNSIGSANLAALAHNFNGNIDQMVWAVQNYNAQPIVDKNGNVTVDQTQLMDAQGNVYTWNGAQLMDKNGTVDVSVGDLRDAQGNLVTWNGTALQSKNGKAKVDKKEVDKAQTAVDKLNGTKLKSKEMTAKASYSTLPRCQSAMHAVMNEPFHSRSATITTTYLTVNRTRNEKAAGGIRHADGGIRMHAHGAIVDAPVTGYPLDWVGEDGAEAIVPLTNRKYSEPFAATIAEQMARIGGQRGDVYNIYLDGSALEVDERVAEALKALVAELKRTVRTGRG